MNGYLLLFLVVLVTLLIGIGLFFLARLRFRKEIQSEANKPNRIKITKGVLLQTFVLVVVLLVVFYFKEIGHRWASILVAMLYMSAHVYKYFVIKNK